MMTAKFIKYAKVTQLEGFISLGLQLFSFCSAYSSSLSRIMFIKLQHKQIEPPGSIHLLNDVLDLNNVKACICSPTKSSLPPQILIV